MPSEAGFWRNVSLIAIAHVGLLITLLCWRKPSLHTVVEPVIWMSGADNEPADSAPLPSMPSITSTPTNTVPDIVPGPAESIAPSEQDHPITPTVKSEIELPSETPTPTPSANSRVKPSADRTPARPISTAKPTATRVKKQKSEKASVSPSAHAGHKQNANRSPSKLPSKNKIALKTAGAHKNEKATADTGHAEEPAENTPSDLNWYGNMLHDRFYREWVQPTTVVAAGAKLSALVKIRIEKDGRVSDFKIIRSSGNVVVNESIAALTNRVTKVDPLPAELSRRDHYDVTINFEFNPAQ